MAVTTTVDLSVRVSETATLDLGSATASHAWTLSGTLSDGTGANAADKVWSDTRTLTSGNSDSLDLSGSLTGVYGTVTFAKVKMIAIKASASNTVEITVGNGTNPAYANIFGDSSGAVVVQPGGCFIWYSPGTTGGTVTNSTADILKVLAGSGSVSYDIIVIGTSA